MNDYKTIVEMQKAFNKAKKELIEEIAKAFRLDVVCDFLNRILRRRKP